MCESLENGVMCMDCRNELNLCKLCVKCIKAKGILAKRVVSDDLCADRAKVSDLSVSSEVANNICVSGALTANAVSAVTLNANNFCLMEGSINRLCVNELQLDNFSPAVKYRATINFSANTTYTLGSFLNFNNIIDDPNGNVSLAPNTSYAAPVDGYYMMTLKVNILNLISTNGPILGIPVANPEIYVNGLVVRDMFAPFLMFFDNQKVLLNSLITLKAGDVVTMKYNILGGGGAPVTGTADILGTGLEDGNSFFKIIFMSALSSGSQPMCTPCQPVSVPCSAVSTVCDKEGVCHLE